MVVQPQASSPFLSESAHVLSLQHPAPSVPLNLSRESLVVAPPQDRGAPDAEVAEAASQDTVVRAVSLNTSHLSASRRWYIRARQGLQARLRPRSRREVALPLPVRIPLRP